MSDVDDLTAEPSADPAGGTRVENGAATDAASVEGQAETLEISEEAVVALIAERDEYLDALQRLKADFANARRRADEQAVERRNQAAAELVEKLLPVLDSCEAALAHGVDQIRPISDALFDVLAAQGLERFNAEGEPFDPQVHEAVVYEQGEGEQIVVETLRSGYRWKSRVLRAPMVKVKG